MKLAVVSYSNKTVEEFVERIQAGGTSYDVFRVLKDVGQVFRFKTFVVMNKIPSENQYALSDLIILTNWEPEFIKASDALQVVHNTSVYAKLAKTSLPVIWRMSDTNADGNDTELEPIRELFARFDHNNGVSFPVTDSGGNRGVVGFTGNREDPSQHEIMELSFISTHAFERLSNISVDLITSKPQLTPREIECISWTAAGKTSSETATILGVTENTVNHYLHTASMKLNTLNKAHTVAEAIRLGLLVR